MDGGSERNPGWPQAQTDILELCHGLPMVPHTSPTWPGATVRSGSIPVLYTSGSWLSRGSLLAFSIRGSLLAFVSSEPGEKLPCNAPGRCPYANSKRCSAFPTEPH